MLSGACRRGRDNQGACRAKAAVCWLCGVAIGVGCLAIPAGAESLGFKAGSGAASSAAAPVDPATMAARAKVISAAIMSLTKEYQAYLKDPKNGKIREKSDYFQENKSADATPDAIMRGLEQSISGGGDVEAYVKWQLLSGIPSSFPPELNKRALAVYRRAPSPFNHPGLNKRGLASERIGKGEVGAASKIFGEVLAQNAERNKPILEYRDELFARLTKDGDAMMAGLVDVGDRAGAGLNANKAFDNVSAGVKSWALMGANPGAARGMAERLLGLKEAVAREENKPYTKLEDNKGAPKWTASATIDPKKVDQLINFLVQTASSPTGGGLKFKDSK